jgi:hypothetical protein
LRSARTPRFIFFEATLVSVVVVSVVVVVVVPLAPIVLPLVLVSVLVVPAVLGGVELLPAAVLGALLLSVVVLLLLPGVPVLPIGVVWVLCWPAPVAGSLEVVVGGVLWAIAAPAIATAAKPASMPLIDAVISETPCFVGWKSPASSPAAPRV